MRTSRTVRISKALPYALLLAAAAYFYHLANHFDFAAPGGRIGPDVWPKAILILLMASCIYELAKIMFIGKAPADLIGVLQDIMQAAPAQDSAAEEAAPLYPRLLIAGVALTVAYAYLIDKLGFFVCTALYMAAFMYVGRYRRHGVIILTSVLGSLSFVFVFMRIVYVSLPLGAGPFEPVSLLLLRLLGIK